MKKNHIMKYFLNWQEKKLSPGERNVVEDHLKTCADCRKYFDQMHLFLSDPELSSIPELQPDSFLPARIKVAAKRGAFEGTFFDSWKIRLRLTFGTAMILFALIVGVFLGRWVSSNSAVSETEVMLSYSAMFNNQGVGEFWDTIANENNGEQP